MADRLIVFGSGGHAKVVIEAALARMPAREIILLDDAEAAKARSIFGITVSGDRAQLSSLAGTPVALAIGDNTARAKVMAWLLEKGHALETVVHPAAIVADSVQIGAGAFVSAGAIIIAEARIGAGVIVNTGASIDHDCAIGEAAHIAPGAHLSGDVQIGARTLVGTGASIRQGISICSDVVLGVGSVVVRDIREPGIFVGNPAGRLRVPNREAD
jgi:sugar O-acyltransferase (sialic acid O-acetyltransferase NeuD family)